MSIGVLLFRLLRAAGEEDDVVVARSRPAVAARCVRGLSRSVCAPSNLSEPVTCDAFGRRAERQEPLGVLVVLRGDQVDLPQHARRPAAGCGGSRGKLWSLSRPLTIATRAPCRLRRARSGSATAPARRAPAASAGCAASRAAPPN